MGVQLGMAGPPKGKANDDGHGPLATWYGIRYSFRQPARKTEVIARKNFRATTGFPVFVGIGARISCSVPFG